MSNHNETLHILGIAPYDSMRDVMQRTAEGFPDLQLDVYIGDLEQGVNIVKNVATQGYDAIISRGGTATMIRQVTDLPVIEIQLSVYDVLRTIKLAENYSSLYAIVGFPTITESAHTLCDLLRYDVDILTIHPQHAGCAVHAGTPAARRVSHGNQRRGHPHRCPADGV